MAEDNGKTKSANRPRIRATRCKNPICSETFEPVNKDHLYHTVACKNAFHKLARQEGEKRLLLGETMVDDVIRKQMDTKETVKASVLRILIQHHPQIKNWQIAQAHSLHCMSGLQRLRELSADGKVWYEFDHKNNFYFIYTSKAKLKKAYIEELKRGNNGRT